MNSVTRTTDAPSSSNVPIEVITTPEQLIRFVKQYKLYDGPVVYDTETDGLFAFKTNRIIGYAFYLPAKKDFAGLAVYIPVRHAKMPHRCVRWKPIEHQPTNRKKQFPEDQERFPDGVVYECIPGKNHPIDLNLDPTFVAKVLAPCFGDGRKMLGFNIKFDKHFTEKEGIEFNNPTYDVMLACQIDDENSVSYSMDMMGPKYCGPDATKYDKQLLEWAKVAWKNKRLAMKTLKGRLRECPLFMVGEYGAYDCILTWEIAKKVAHSLKKQGLMALSREIATDYSEAYQRVEKNGILVNQEYAIRSMEHAEQRIQLLYEAMVKEVGYEFNPGSNEQVAKILYGWEPKYFVNQLTGKRMKMSHPSTDKAALAVSKHPLAPILEEYREWTKSIQTYYRPWMTHCDANGRLHPNIKIEGTVAGRPSCVAEGTLIEVVRDVSKWPKGVPIEHVKEGDIAYTFDVETNLCLRKVMWAAKTGHKKILRIHWAGRGRRHRGFTDLTPEHRVRLADGHYIPAALLSVGDSVMAVSRGRKGKYARLWATGIGEISREHRFIYEQLTGESSEHVHHKNENTLDNRLSNLKGMTAKEHLSLHGRNPSDALRKKRSENAKQQWVENPWKMPSGKESHNYLGLEKVWMEEVLWQNAGRPTVFRDIYGIDYETAQKYMKMHGIDYREIAIWFDSDGNFLSNERIKELRKIYEERGQRTTLREGRTHYYKFKKVQERLGYVPYNHIVTEIEELPDSVNVYDLTIEETHNFIANEICVENCTAPNMMNLPRTDERTTYDCRGAIVAGPGNILLSRDASQIELRGAAQYSKDPEWTQVYMDGGDIHQATADTLCALGVQVTRQDAKQINFSMLYNMGPPALSKKLGVSEDKAREILNNFKYSKPKLVKLQRDVERHARDFGYIELWTGRRRRYPHDWMIGTALNNLIQGFAAEVLRHSVIKLDKMLRETNVKIILTIYDDILFEMPEEEVLHWNPKIKAVMDDWPQFQIPILSEGKAGYSWSEMVKCDKPFKIGDRVKCSFTYEPGQEYEGIIIPCSDPKRADQTEFLPLNNRSIDVKIEGKTKRSVLCGTDKIDFWKG